MASIEFYDVKTRKKVKIDESKIKKVEFQTKKGQTRYGIQAKTDDGRNLTKFVSKSEWDKLNVPKAQRLGLTTAKTRTAGAGFLFPRIRKSECISCEVRTFVL